jgi:peptide/nickel transport system substrate-binding protein
MASYWNKVLDKRLTRRRAMAATGMTAAAAAFLAACGGGDDDNGGTIDTTKGDTSGLVTAIEDASKNAVVGGTFVWPNNREPLHFDGKAQGQVQLNHHNGLAYESLVRNKPGLKQASTWTEVEPQLAESFEVSPDKLTLTFKLRQGVKWHNKAPVNGRIFDAEDVVTTWKNFEEASTPNNKGANSNKINPAAPVLSFEAPDPKTVVIKLKEPSSYMLQRLASMITGEIGSIYPKETYKGFDPKLDQIGTGPYMLDKFTPSVSVVHKRNPDYWDAKNAGFVDTVQFPLLAEYAAQLAQLKAGALSSMVVTPTDVVQTKKDSQSLSMYLVTAATNNPGASMRFGWANIGDKKSPFLDQRVRQALSMGFDREAAIDATANVSNFESAGLPVASYWHTAIGYIPGVTLDPRDAKSFGENAKYYQYNVEEAKKLFSAAKSAYGSDFPEIPAGRVNAVFGAAYLQDVDIMDQFARDVGFKVAATPLDYNLDYLPKYVTQQGKISGLFYGIGAVTSPDPTDYFVWRFYSKSGATSGSLGFGGPDGSKGDQSGDVEVDALIEKAKAEFDAKKRTELIADIQRILGKQQYMIARPGFADSFQLAWPAIENYATFQGDSRVILNGTNGINLYWYNSAKPHKA